MRYQLLLLLDRLFPHLQICYLVPCSWCCHCCCFGKQPTSHAAALHVVISSNLQCSHTRHASVGFTWSVLRGLYHCKETHVLKTMAALQRSGCMLRSLLSSAQHKC